jgi:hypothetical protein
LGDSAHGEFVFEFSQFLLFPFTFCSHYSLTLGPKTCESGNQPFSGRRATAKGSELLNVEIKSLKYPIWLTHPIAWIVETFFYVPSNFVNFGDIRLGFILSAGT